MQTTFMVSKKKHTTSYKKIELLRFENDPHYGKILLQHDGKILSWRIIFLKEIEKLY